MSSQQEFSKHVTSFFNEVISGRKFFSYSHFKPVFPSVILLAIFS